ncbi:MAG TPA: hypothetical protein PK253_03315 [Spirochaetota bacterium]|nr:hypothetical protein [Spirochaetota bacterium]
MSKTENTKDKLGLQNIDDKTKKDLFNKFVQAGGQVVQEKKKSGLSDFDREKQMNYRKKIETHRSTIQEKRPAPQGRTSQAGSRPAARRPSPAVQASSLAESGNFLDRMSIRFRLYFMGIADFFNPAFKKTFIERFNTDYKSALLEAQMVYLDIFKQNPTAGKVIITQLDKARPLYFETIEMIANVYDRTRFLNITEAFESFPDIPQRLADHEELMTYVFKRLYVLRQFSDLILNAFEKAIQIQMKIEKKKASVYSAKRKRIRNSLFVIFHKMLPRLYWLFCRYQARTIPMGDPVIESLLNITVDDKPGKRKAFEESEGIEIPVAPQREEDEQGDDEEEQEEQVILPDEIKKGMELMYSIDLQKLKGELERRNVFRFTTENDKIHITALLLYEFDRDYSLILTTNKIKYNVMYEATGKVDYKTQLSDMYNDLRSCLDSVSEYASVVEAYEKARLDKPLSNDQYVSYSKKLQLLEKNRKQSAHKCRVTIRTFMGRVADILKPLIADMNGDQKIVSNPQDLLQFDSDIEGSRKLGGRKIYETIFLTYCYASALAHRLSPEGDLAGELEFKEGEARQSYTEPQNGESETPEDREPQGPKKKAEPSEKKDNGKSVLSELDDLF